MPPRAYQLAIAELRRCSAALARGPTAEERLRLLALHDQALRTLEQARRRPATDARLARLAHLQRTLADMPAGDRRRAICERLGISRSRYYELVNAIDESGNKAGPDFGLIQP
jgi:hypothetical protein